MTIQVKGLKEIEELLEKLPDRVSANAIAASLRAGATIIAKAAREKLRGNPSIDSGLLEQSITSRSRRKQRKGKYYGQQKVSIGALRVARQVTRKGSKSPVKAVPSRYAHLVEFGTKNMPAEPFMRPALDENGEAAIRRIGEMLGKRVEAEAAKLAAKNARLSSSRRG